MGVGFLKGFECAVCPWGFVVGVVCHDTFVLGGTISDH